MKTSIKNNLVNLVKYSKAIYKVYYLLANGVLRVASRLVSTDRRLLLFNTFAGRSYGDSTRALYEALRKDSRFAGYHVVWAFHDPDQFAVPGAKKVKTDTPRYFLTALAARAWVTNSSVERGLRFKRDETLYLNTWHGTPIKKMGSDINVGNTSFKPKGEGRFDAMCVQGEYEAAIWARAFGVTKDQLVRTGLPRNDELVSSLPEHRVRIRIGLGIPENKLAILYCPTFREYDKDKALGVIMRPPMDLGAWERELGSDHVLMVRAHYEVAKAMGIPDGAFAMDVTHYPSLNELIIASDMLISDYSSVFFDYAITGKPMLHYCYDYERYAAHRGMYFDIREWVDGSGSQDDLIDIVKNLDMSKASVRTAVFREKFVDYYGNATKRTLDVLWNLLNG